MKKDHFHASVLAFLPDQLHELSSGQTEASLSQQEEYQPNNSSNMGKSNLHLSPYSAGGLSLGSTGSFLCLWSYPCVWFAPRSTWSRFGRPRLRPLFARLRLNSAPRVSLYPPPPFFLLDEDNNHHR